MKQIIKEKQIIKNNKKIIKEKIKEYYGNK